MASGLPTSGGLNPWAPAFVPSPRPARDEDRVAVRAPERRSWVDPPGHGSPLRQGLPAWLSGGGAWLAAGGAEALGSTGPEAPGARWLWDDVQRTKEEGRPRPVGRAVGVGEGGRKERWKAEGDGEERGRGAPGHERREGRRRRTSRPPGHQPSGASQTKAAAAQRPGRRATAGAMTAAGSSTTACGSDACEEAVHGPKERAPDALGTADEAPPEKVGEAEQGRGPGGPGRRSLFRGKGRAKESEAWRSSRPGNVRIDSWDRAPPGGPLFRSYEAAHTGCEPPATGWLGRATARKKAPPGKEGEGRGRQWPYTSPGSAADVERVLFAIAAKAERAPCFYCVERDRWRWRDDGGAPVKPDGCACTFPEEREWAARLPPSRGVRARWSRSGPRAPSFAMCEECESVLGARHVAEHPYLAAGGAEMFKGHGGYGWSANEKYCLEHWRRWLHWALAGGKRGSRGEEDCEGWVEWAEAVIRAPRRSRAPGARAESAPPVAEASGRSSPSSGGRLSRRAPSVDVGGVGSGAPLLKCLPAPGIQSQGARGSEGEPASRSHPARANQVETVRQDQSGRASQSKPTEQMQPVRGSQAKCASRSGGHRLGDASSPAEAD